MRRYSSSRNVERRLNRSGVITMLTVFLMTAIIWFLVLGIDLAFIMQQKQAMQNAADASALAAALEITNAIKDASGNAGNAATYAQNAARQVAVDIAKRNNQFVDSQLDVRFGQRAFDKASGTFQVLWDATPANVVKISIRKNSLDRSSPNARVQTAFAGFFGGDAGDLVVSAVASVESRDIVSVLDFSRSMNFDSYFNSDASAVPSTAKVQSNLRAAWNDLGSPRFGNMPFNPDWITIPSITWGSSVKVRWKSAMVEIDSPIQSLQLITLTFSDGNTQTIVPKARTGNWAGTGHNEGKLISKCDCTIGEISESFNFFDNGTIKRGLDLDGVAYPWPKGSWDEYISMVRDTNGSFYDAQIEKYGFRNKFGIMTFLHYVMRFNSAYEKTPVLWKVRHYPFSSLKDGQQLLCNYLESLQFNDCVGMVSYDTSHRVEQILKGPEMPSINISASPITTDYQAIRDIIRCKQSGHYSNATNIGGGLKEARTLLLKKGRPGARATIVLITDGNANTIDAGESTSLPSNWNWHKLFDYDNNGVANYNFGDTDENARYVLKKAKECVDAGITINAISVGADADTKLMRAVAHLGKGLYVECPPSQNSDEFHEQVERAFKRIAAFVPPVRLLNPDASSETIGIIPGGPGGGKQPVVTPPKKTPPKNPDSTPPKDKKIIVTPVPTPITRPPANQ